MKTKTSLIALWALLAVTSSAQAGPLARDQVPEPLKPWTDWVLKGHEEDLCPFLQGLEDERYCAWASPLTLSLDEKSGRFAQDWRLFADDWISLPGDADHWPLGVMVDGKAAAIILQEEEPSIFLPAGDHSIQGSFQWDSLPESFSVPIETGALKLSVRGADVARPNITDEGVLWLQTQEKEKGGEETDSLDARIHRLIEDDIPLVLTTSITLDVSGKSREAVFAPLLPKGFVPMSLESPLPAHLEENGTLKIQVRSGHWQVRLRGRHEGPTQEIMRPALPKDGSNLVAAEEEVWVLSTRPELRQVTVEGTAEAIDPQQTTLPDEWKRLAAYRVPPGGAIKLVEQRRGDADPAPDQLSLYRSLWLDFDGTGYTVQDRIDGTFNRNTRLEMGQPVALGRVSVDGQDQLITKLPGQEKSGIEVRQGSANIGADSRLDGVRASIPAIGWNHDFQSVSGTLHLPPGWRAIGVWGADHVPNTWLNRWSLLDIFLVLVLSLSFAKIWNIRWGWIAIAGLTLTFTEADAPRWAWLAVLVGEALVRLLPPGFKGKIRIPLKIYRATTVVILVIITIPFAVVSLRKSLYPSLERMFSSIAPFSTNSMLSEAIPPPPMALPSPAPMEAGAGYDDAPGDGEFREKGLNLPAVQSAMEQRKVLMVKKELPDRLPRSLKKSLINQNVFQQAPGAQVQTGPGLPRWDWTGIPLQWNGPVAAGQKLTLILFGPTLNLFIALIRLVLLGLLVLRILGFPGKFWPRFVKQALIGGLTVVLGIGFLATPRTALAGDFPSTELLNDLRARLMEKPDCTPNCAAISRMVVEAAPATLRLRIEVASQALTAVPLPANPKEWIPAQVSIDGDKFAAVRRSADGRAWVEVGPGVHLVVVEGGVGDRQSLEIPLPLKPHHVSTSLQGWSIEGIHEDGQAEDNLQLTRTEPLAAAATSGAKAVTSNLPPFVRVERKLVLGLTWSVETQVIRLTPTGNSIVLEVPLLASESVTTDGVRVQNGKVLVSMGPQTSDFSWSSVLQQSDKLALVASTQSSWIETWEIDASPIWHLQTGGIPVIRRPGQEATTQWRPWPGEKVSLDITRPEGAPGQTVTIDESNLSVVPGIRFAESTLHLTIRSSLGGQHAVTIPDGAELQSVSVDGQVQPIRLVDQKIALPLTPGSQSFDIKWQQPGGIGLFFRTPKVDLGVSSVNAEVQFNLPERWVLLVGGPSLGPAVLFWSLLIVMALVAYGLSRTDLAPLEVRHWLLLTLGLTQTPIWASLFFAGWFLVMGWRGKIPRPGAWSFDLLQIALVGWTVVAIIILFVSIHQGLLGSPDMQILGNDSSNLFLKWFQDRTSSILPRPWVISLPMFCYRLAMLSWALWVAWAFISWLKWGWKCFTKGDTWKPVRLVKKSN